MKKFKKAAALLLTGALLAGSASAMFTASAAKTETIGGEDVLGSYQNDFNDTTLAELESDFYFAYDSVDNTNNITNDENTWKLDTITAAEAATYMGAADGKLLRKSGVSMEGTDPERFSFQQLYMYYKNQSFSNFEMEITVAPSPRTVNMIHFAPQCDNQSSIYKNGFTLAFLAGTGNNGITMWLGDDEDARTALKNWNIGTSGTNAVSAQNSKGEYASYQFKIRFENGVASVYVDGAETPALKREGLAEGNYYASVALGKVIWGTTTVDDFSIKEIVPEVVVDRLEEKGKYLNCFGAGDLAAVLGDDFALRYDNENWNTAEAATELSVSDAANYLVVENGALRRKNTGETGETGIWDGVRPYWQQVYLYYKNQSFRNFEFSVDMQFSPASFTEIRFAPYTSGTIYSSGFTFAVKADGVNYRMILGDYEEMNSNLYGNENNWSIADSVSQYVFNNGSEGVTFNIRITFDNGTAKVYLNGGEEPVLVRSGLQRVDYYPAIALGAATGWGPTTVDNFSITELENVYAVSADNNGAKMVLREVNDIKEAGFKAATADGEIVVSTDYANESARGKLPFKVMDGAVYYSDLDLDGEMGATDVAMLRTYLLNGNDSALADITKDGAVNILDFVRMKKVMASVDTVEATDGRYTYYFILPEGATEVTPYYITNDGTEITGEVIVLN